MASSSGIRAGKAFVEINGEDKGLRGTLDHISKTFNEWGKNIRNAGLVVAGFGLAVEGALSAAIGVFTEMGDSLAKASERTGISVESLSQLKYAADRAGLSFEDFETGVKKMQKTVVSAAEGTQAARDSLARLHLTVADLNGLSPDKQFEKIATAISKIPDPTEKAALAMEIFGKSGTGLIPLLDEGADGIKALMDRADALGITMSTKDAKAAESLHDNLEELWSVVKMGTFAIGAALAPALDEFVTIATNATSIMKKFADSHRELVVYASAATAVVVGFGGALVIAGYAIEGIGTSLGLLSAGISLAGAIGTSLAGAFVGVGGLAVSAAAGIGALLSPLILIGAAAVGIGAYFIASSGVAAGAMQKIQSSTTMAGGYIKSVFVSVGQFLNNVWQTVKADAVEAFGGIMDALKSGDWSTAAAILWTTIKLEFNRGMQGLWDPLVSAFYQVKAALSDAWVATVADLQKTWSYAVEYLTTWDGIKAAAGKFFTWITDAWSAVVNMLAQKFARFMVDLDFKDTEKQIREIGAQRIAEGKDTQAGVDQQVAKARADAYAALDKQGAIADQERTQAFKDAMKAIDDNFAKKQPDLAKQGDDARAKIDDQKAKSDAANQKSLVDALAKIDPTRAAEIEALKKHLDELTTKAKAEGKNVPSLGDRWDKLKSQVEDGLGFDVQKETFKSVGTFNASALFGLGDGSIQQKIAQSTERTAKATEKIADKPGAAFG